MPSDNEAEVVTIVNISWLILKPVAPRVGARLISRLPDFGVLGERGRLGQSIPIAVTGKRRSRAVADDAWGNSMALLSLIKCVRSAEPLHTMFVVVGSREPVKVGKKPHHVNVI